MSLTYRDKEQLLQLLSVVAPMGERMVTNAIEAPARQQQETLQRAIQEAQLAKYQTEAGEDKAMIPLAAAEATIGNKAKMFANAQGMVPRKDWQAVLTADSQAGRLALDTTKFGAAQQTKEKETPGALLKTAQDTRDSLLKFISDNEYTNRELATQYLKQLPQIERKIKLYSKLNEEVLSSQSPTLPLDKLPQIESLVESKGLTADKVKALVSEIAAAERITESGMSNIPTPGGGGKISRGGETALQTLERELKEGLGISTEDVKELIKYYKILGEF